MLSVGDFGLGNTNLNSTATLDANDITYNGFSAGGGVTGLNFFDLYSGLISVVRSGGSDGKGTVGQLQINAGGALAVRGMGLGKWSSWMQAYTTGNTIKASDGTLKAASPVVKVFSDGTYETNEESEGVTVTRLGVGQYLIEGCEALNSDAAWGGIDGGFDIPTDRNKQPLIWLDYKVNADGSVLVETYHRTHSASPAFARNERDGLSDGDPVDIPSDQFVSVRVQMPMDSAFNRKQIVWAMAAEA